MTAVKRVLKLSERLASPASRTRTAVKLFINYRRDDTDDLAGRLHDRLIAEFGSDNGFEP